jgi:hypothetical protein
MFTLIGKIVPLVPMNYILDGRTPPKKVQKNINKEISE